MSRRNDHYFPRLCPKAASTHPMQPAGHRSTEADSSIFFYLMDPLGQFVDAFGKATLADEVMRKTLDAMDKWEKAGGHAAAGLPRIQ